MKKLFKIILFALFIFGNSNIEAATATGDVQIDLATPLSIEVNSASANSVNLGTIAIDGPGTVTLNSKSLTCPENYICTGSTSYIEFLILGKPDTQITVNLEGNGVMKNLEGDSLIFTPNFASRPTMLILGLIGPHAGKGIASAVVTGSVLFTGNESEGYYSTQNVGGEGFDISVVY